MAEYIHQLPAWPKFEWDQYGLARQLAAVRHRQGRLIGRMQALGFALREEAVLRTLTEDVLKSSEIEGEILDKEQVRSSIARRLGMEAAALPSGDRNVEGVVEMMLDATQKYSDELTADRLFGWHASLFPTGRSGMTQNRRRRLAGRRVRTDAGCLRRLMAASESITRRRSPRRLDAEMQAFLDWFNGAGRYRSGTEGRTRASLVRHHPSVRGRQRTHRARHRRHGARALGREPAALLQHVRANPARTQRLLRHTGSDAERATSTSRPGWNGSCGALTAPSTAPRNTLASVFKKADFWKKHSRAAQ